ncbi:hypothetical protein H0X10_00790 [Candidatus Saccharibacteria bacterium]|nr:hypothetical protein [Candidatus Saccharibacteria bacterium]
MLKRKKKIQPEVRNRQNSGSSAPVFSYYSNRSTSSGTNTARNMTGLNNDRAVTKTPWWLGYMPSLVAGTLVLLSGIYVTTLTDNVRIQITTKDTRPVVVQEMAVYERAAQDLLEQSVLNKSKLTINTNKIADELERQFPELGDTAVTVPLIGRKLIIQVSPAQPVLILAVRGDSFVIDDDGTAVLKSSQLVSSTRDKLPVITDDTGILAEIGQQLLTTDLVAFTRQLAANLGSKQIGIESYSLPAVANELHVRPEGKGYYIKFNTEIDVRLQVGTYIAVSEKLEADGITPTEYIDVRIEERAYYK